VERDYLGRLEDGLRALKGSRYQSFSSDDLESARKLYVDMMSGRSNRAQSDFRIAVTFLICGVLVVAGGLVLRLLAAVAFGSVIAVIGACFVFKFYGSKTQGDQLTKATRLDALKRIHEQELISSQEYHDAVGFVTEAADRSRD
jgi:hypothetical protein